MLTRRTERGPSVARRAAIAAIACAVLVGLVPATATAAAKPYVLDLGARADFVAQTNNVQCVGASIQMMLNMIRPGVDRTKATQLKAQKLARSWSGPRRDGHERRGASVLGWASALVLLGAGPYALVGTTTIEEALQVAAAAMQQTGRPVGLLVWRGRHAWVMSGFRATADPAKGGRVTAAIVEDPLYPHGSKTWGPSPAPGQALSVKQLGRQFVPRRTSSFFSNLAGKYVLVLPYAFDVRAVPIR
jgi:hypothetical protein